MVGRDVAIGGTAQCDGAVKRVAGGITHGRERVIDRDQLKRGAAAIDDSIASTAADFLHDGRQRCPELLCVDQRIRDGFTLS